MTIRRSGNVVQRGRATEYTPNHIPKSARILNVVLSTILLIYGGFGVWADDLFLPGRATSGVHLHGEPAWIMYAAMIVASFNLLSVVVDHYDRRNNETNYRQFARITQVGGWLLFGSALLLDIIIFFLHKSAW